MLRKIITIIFIISICFLSIGGCKKSSSESEEQVKTITEYQTEAEKQINQDNMDDNLAAVEKEIEQDTSTEP